MTRWGDALTQHQPFDPQARDRAEVGFVLWADDDAETEVQRGRRNGEVIGRDGVPRAAQGREQLRSAIDNPKSTTGILASRA